MSCIGCDHREKPKGSGIYVWCNKENKWVSEHVGAHETAVPCPNHSDSLRSRDGRPDKDTTSESYSGAELTGLSGSNLKKGVKNECN